MFIQLSTVLVLLCMGNVLAKPNKLQGLSAVDLYESYLVSIPQSYVNLFLISYIISDLQARLHYQWMWGFCQLLKERKRLPGDSDRLQ
jgi:hypothetical protein